METTHVIATLPVDGIRVVRRSLSYSQLISKRLSEFLLDITLVLSNMPNEDPEHAVWARSAYSPQRRC